MSIKVVQFVRMFCVADSEGAEQWFAIGDDDYLYKQDAYGKWVIYSSLPQWTERAE